jgi:PadR family transcriptional regulator, regulatory protein PadR
MNTQFKKGVVEMCVMHLLARKDMTAYDVLSKVEKALNVNANTVYPILRRLEEDKLLLYEKVQQKMGAPRKQYSLTDKGKEELVELKKEYNKMTSSVKAIMGE